MRRWATVSLLAALLAAGCSNIRPPSVSDNERQQLRFDWNHANFQLSGIERELARGSGSHRDLYEKQVRIADLEWKLGWLPYNTYHTRRRDSLVRLRHWVTGKAGQAGGLEVERADLRVQKERSMLKEIAEDDWRGQLSQFRAKLAAHVRQGRSEAAAQVAEEMALKELEAELGGW